MKNKQIEQLKKILEIFGESIINPSSYTGIKAVFVSGKNKYPIDITFEKNNDGYKYIMPFIGKKEIVTSDKFIETFLKQALLYDSIEIEFYERGGGKKILADDRGVKVSNIDKAFAGLNKTDETDGLHKNIQTGVSQTRDYYIRTDEASELLRAIGILDDKNKVKNDKIRKYNQIDRFVELANPIIQDLIKMNEKIYILDCACGKSYLSFVLNYYIREKLSHPCEFLGLDWSESVIESSKELATTLKYTNMKFMQCDLSQYYDKDFKPSICMSLHACDTATDLAIFTGIRSKSNAILCVPCCQKELLTSDYKIPFLDNSVMKHGLLKARFSDILTDAMRVLILEAYGYETSIIEYISPLDSPKNILIKSKYTGKTNHASKNEYKMLKEKFSCEITLGKLLGI